MEGLPCVFLSRVDEDDGGGLMEAYYRRRRLCHLMHVIEVKLKIWHKQITSENIHTSTPPVPSQDVPLQIYKAEQFFYPLKCVSPHPCFAFLDNGMGLWFYMRSKPFFNVILRVLYPINIKSNCLQALIKSSCAGSHVFVIEEIHDLSVVKLVGEVSYNRCDQTAHGERALSKHALESVPVGSKVSPS